MALGFEHGAIQWNAADPVATVYTVSSLPFQPKAIRFYWMGLGSAVDAASEVTHSRRGVGFATSITNRMCLTTQDQDGTGSMTCTTGFFNERCCGLVTSTPGDDGSLDLDSITSDGFTLIVDIVAPVNITIFWEAWGGSDITFAEARSFLEPAAIGDVDYTATGFVAGATDQVVMFAGSQRTVLARNDSGLCVGFATGGADADNVVVVGNSDDGNASGDTDGYCKTGECLAMITVGGGDPDARAKLTQFGTGTFRLNWIARAVTGRTYISLAIKGGQWKAGSLTIGSAVPVNGDTATLSGLAFTPKGLCLMCRFSVEQTAGTAVTLDRLALGSGTSTSSRRCMSHYSEDGTANAEVNLVIEYDQILAIPNTIGGVTGIMDIDAMNADGWQIITESGGHVQDTWLGYLTFGDAPGAPAAASRWSFIGAA